MMGESIAAVFTSMMISFIIVFADWKLWWADVKRASKGEDVPARTYMIWEREDDNEKA